MVALRSPNLYWNVSVIRISICASLKLVGKLLKNLGVKNVVFVKLLKNLGVKNVVFGDVSTFYLLKIGKSNYKQISTV